MAHVSYEYNKLRILNWRELHRVEWREYQRNYMARRRALSKLSKLSKLLEPQCETPEPKTS